MEKNLFFGLMIVGVLCCMQSSAMEQQMTQYEKDKPNIMDRNAARMFGFYSFNTCKEIIEKDSRIPFAWHKPDSNDPCTMLHIAVEHDNVAAARALLEANPLLVNTQTIVNKYAPLHMVCSKPMAKLLLAYNAKLESKDEDGLTPLYNVLFQGQGIYSRFSCLDQLCVEQKQEIAHYLLKKGANKNAINYKDGSVLLHKAVGQGYSLCDRYPDYVDLLLKHRADSEIENNKKQTSYDLAVSLCDRCDEVLKSFKKHAIFFIQNDNKYGRFLKLIKKSPQDFKKLIDLNAVVQDYNICKIENNLADLLIMARVNSSLDGGVTISYDQGYCFNKVNYKNLEDWMGKESLEYFENRFDSCCQKALLLAQQGEYLALEKIVYNYHFILRYDKKSAFNILLQLMTEDKDMFSYLLKNGCPDLSMVDEDGNSLLHKAIELKNIQAITLLIKNKISLLTVNNNGRTPVELLYELNDLGSIEAFKFSFIDTFFSTYSYQNSYQEIKKIFKDGFDVNVCDEKGISILMKAIESYPEKYYQSTMESCSAQCLFLLKHGATVTQEMLNKANNKNIPSYIVEQLQECYQNQQ